MRFRDWIPPEIKDGEPTKYQWMVKHADKFKLGYKTDIGAFTYINAQYGVTIEDYVQVGSHCSIYSVSTIDNKQGSVILKKNCKVGSHSVVMPGIVIGENSIIGAFSFINLNIPKNSLAFGIPIRIIRSLDESEIQSPE